jgi:isopenicillin-N N-acyltransferase-like protein
MGKRKWIRHVKISGTAFERGCQLGTLCREEVENTLESYGRVFKRYGNLDKSDILKLATPFIDIIAKYDPELIEEISGIAKAMEHPIEELVAINARTELMFQNAIKECTSIAVLPDITSGDKIFIGQNWDWIEMLRGSLILLEVEQPDRPTILMLAEAGIIGKIGMNSSGIGVCLNVLIADGAKRGVPIHVILRGILNSETLGEAIGSVLRAGSGGCSHFLIGSTDGEAIGIEVAFHDAEVIYPAEGIFTHANHFLSKSPERKDQGRVRYPDSLIRDYRALRALRAKKKKLSLEDLKSVLCDHFNYPHSICRHPAPKTDELEEIVSLASVIMDLKSRTLHLAEGPPCKHPYLPFSLKAMNKRRRTKI